MTKVNYDRFASFDINEACDHFQVHRSRWTGLCERYGRGF